MAGARTYRMYPAHESLLSVASWPRNCPETSRSQWRYPARVGRLTDAAILVDPPVRYFKFPSTARCSPLTFLETVSARVCGREAWKVETREPTTRSQPPTGRWTTRRKGSENST
ncbi:hypothetical protein VTO42DRAFT_1740 [Malbranchea cinnamomea]